MHHRPLLNQHERSHLTVTVALTEASAHEALDLACERTGLDPSGAELIRLGSNAVFRLRTPVIVRIARDGESLTSARRQVNVARWLDEVGYPAARALDIEQPLDIDGHVTTFWESATEGEEYAPLADVGSLLRRLHTLAAPAGLALPETKPFAELGEKMPMLDNLHEDDADFLRRRIDDLRRRYDELDFVLEPGPIHGDANIGNVILDRDGNPLLIDLDSFGTGPREWDLVQTALFYERFGWHTEDEYRSFVDAYGFDIMNWSGYKVLADYREISMTLWLCGKAGSEERAATEVRKRIETIKSGGDRREWAPF